MHPRQTLQEMFSSFIWFENDTFHSWKEESQLSASMKRKLQSDPSSASASRENEQFWALCWHQDWRKSLELCDDGGPEQIHERVKLRLNRVPKHAYERAHEQAKLHLMAYLQEPCYWVAQDIYRKVSGRRVVSSFDRVSDYFQMAIAEISVPLRRFDPERSNNLKGFARMVLQGCLIDILRRRDAVDSCTPWGLLRKSAKKTIQATLTQEGFNGPQIEQSLFLWMVFNTIYAPTQPGAGGKLPPPTPAQCEAIAALYNSKRSGQLTQPSASLTPDAVEESLKRLAASIQRYLQPPTVSIDVPISSDDAESSRLGDWLVREDDPPTLIHILIEKEDFEARAHAQSALGQRLVEAFNQQLTDQQRRVLCALYVQELSQQQTAKRIGMSQTTVSRRCDKAQEQLLKSILTWKEEQLHHFPNPNELKNIEVALDLWLMDALPKLGLCEPLDD